MSGKSTIPVFVAYSLGVPVRAFLSRDRAQSDGYTDIRPYRAYFDRRGILRARPDKGDWAQEDSESSRRAVLSTIVATLGGAIAIALCLPKKGK